MIVLSLVPLLLAVPIGATVDTTGSPGDSVVVLPEVQVSRPRIEDPAHRRLPTGSVTVLEAGAAGRALESLAELLGDAAGVRVQQYGGLGAFSTVSVRGAPAGQVAIFLDGMPLTSASHSVVSLGDLPASAVERVEIYRGSSPLELGPAAPGGAINLVTVSSLDASNRGRARIAGGAFGTWEAAGDAEARRGRLSGAIHAGVQRSRGDFTYPDDNGTPFNPDDDSTSTRQNNHFSAATLLASGTWRPAQGWRLGARADLFEKAQGVPGLGAVPAFETHLDFGRARGALEAVRDGEGATPGVRVSAGLGRERTRFRDPGAELGLGSHDTDDRTGERSLGLDLDWQRLPHALAFGAGGVLRGEWARPTDAADGLADPPESRRLTAGGGMSLQWRPLHERLIVHGAARADRIVDRMHWVSVGGPADPGEVRRTLVSPELGVRWQLALGLALRANASRAGRAPDFMELFGNQGSVIGNPALLPEHTRNADLGLAWSHAWERGTALDVDVAHFESRAEDLVVYIRHSQSSVRAENIARARIRGEELSLRLTSRSPRPRVTVTGGFTHLASRDEGPVPFWYGRDLPLRPTVQAFTRVDGALGAVRLSANLEYIGTNYLDRANLRPVSERLPVGASISFDPRTGLRFTLEGKNLGNDPIDDVGGFPLPGRALFASCELSLGPSTTPTR